MDAVSTSSHVAALRGAKTFVRENTRSDRFHVHGFHSIEFWCSDATNVHKRYAEWTQHACSDTPTCLQHVCGCDHPDPLRRFQLGLGMSLVAKSDLSTVNSMYASYVLKSNDLVFVFTAPYSRTAWRNSPPSEHPLPYYDQQKAHDFVACHGLAVRAVGEACSQPT